MKKGMYKAFKIKAVEGGPTDSWRRPTNSCLKGLLEKELFLMILVKTMLQSPSKRQDQRQWAAKYGLELSLAFLLLANCGIFTLLQALAAHRANTQTNLRARRIQKRT